MEYIHFVTKFHMSNSIKQKLHISLSSVTAQNFRILQIVPLCHSHFKSSCDCHVDITEVQRWDGLQQHEVHAKIHQIHADIPLSRTKALKISVYSYLNQTTMSNQNLTEPSIVTAQNQAENPTQCNEHDPEQNYGHPRSNGRAQ